ncbi:hypothetical protein ABBQ38_001225 [Trebouxia sp. C0009 RCD-2024]
MSRPHKDKGRVLQFASIHTQAASPFESSILTDAGAAEASLLSANSSRTISASPFRVLDAPGLIDDFYVSLIDWSQQGLLAAALGMELYVYNTITSRASDSLYERTFKLASYQSEDISIRSVAWSQSGAHLAIGLGNGKVDLWDISKMQKVRTFIGHRASVSALSWNSHLLSTGGADRVILHRDMRVPEFSVARLQGHRGQVAGLKWSRDDRELASGGNDNTVLLWRAGVSKPQQTIRAHKACVKALAWSPHQAGLLATGGGTSDRTIALWNTVRGSMVHSVHTGSQICGLAWSESVNELLSTHGYADNTINVWKAPSLTKAASLTGHTKRVLFLAMSPDGQTAATGAGSGDETVRFWRVFPAANKLSALKHVSNESRSRIR